MLGVYIWRLFIAIALVAWTGPPICHVATSLVGCVGFGFTPVNQSAGIVSLEDNSTVELCFAARKAYKGSSENRTGFTDSGKIRIIDSGATWSLSGDNSIWVGERKTLRKPKYISGFDDNRQAATEVGTVLIHTNIRGRPTKLLVDNVYYVPAMGSTTLLSMGALDDQGFEFRVGQGVARCYNSKGKAVWDAVKIDGLYRLNFASDFASDYCMMTKDEAHVKFGHLSEPMLRDLGDFEGNLSP